MDNDIEEIRTSLRKIIQKDRNYYDKVLNDPLFKDVKSHVLDLRRDLLRETQLKTEKELSSLEINFKQYTNIPDTLKLPTSTIEMIKNTKLDIVEIKRKMRNNSYFDYLDILDMIAVINSRLIDVRKKLIELQHSTENSIKDLGTSLKNLDISLLQTKSHINKMEKEVKTFEFIRLFDFIIAILLCIFLVIFSATERVPVIVISIALGIIFFKIIGCPKNMVEYISQLFVGSVIGFIGLIVLGIVGLIVNFLLLIIFDFLDFVNNDSHLSSQESGEITNTFFMIFLVITAIALFIPNPTISTKISTLKSEINNEKRKIIDIESKIEEQKLLLRNLNNSKTYIPQMYTDV